MARERRPCPQSRPFSGSKPLRLWRGEDGGVAGLQPEQVFVGVGMDAGVVPAHELAPRRGPVSPGSFPGSTRKARCASPMAPRRGSGSTATAARRGRGWNTSGGADALSWELDSVRAMSQVRTHTSEPSSCGRTNSRFQAFHTTAPSASPERLLRKRAPSENGDPRLGDAAGRESEREASSHGAHDRPAPKHFPRIRLPIACFLCCHGCLPFFSINFIRANCHGAAKTATSPGSSQKKFAYEPASARVPSLRTSLTRGANVAAKSVSSFGSRLSTTR